MTDFRVLVYCYYAFCVELERVCIERKLLTIQFVFFPAHRRLNDYTWICNENDEFSDKYDPLVA